MGCACLQQFLVGTRTLAATAAGPAVAGMTDSPLLMALHSSTERFGVAVSDPQRPGGSIHAVFDDGRGLSNSLLQRVATLLPANRWRALDGLAVATGPGGFTGTRLSVVMARTLAQQLRCPLLGVTSDALMAARLAERFPDPAEPFWISRELRRRGTVAGCYRVINGRVDELEIPHLVAKDRDLGPRTLPADEDVAADVQRLLLLLREAVLAGVPCPWQRVLPIYPTSPVGEV